MPKPCQQWPAGGCTSSNAELQLDGMHRSPSLLMAANLIKKLTKVTTMNKLLALCLFLSIELPAVIEARPVDGEAGGEIHS